MQTLLIFVFIISGATDGGAATHVHEVRFSNALECEAAASRVRLSGSIWGKNVGGIGHYRIDAVCVSGIR